MATFEDQLSAQRRRLQQLRLQKAQQGINADPSVNIQIEDLERALRKADEVGQQLKLLGIYRRTLQHLLNQRASFGALAVPSHIINQIESERRHVAEIKSWVRNAGWPVDNEAVDADAEESHRGPISQMSYANPSQQIREGLRDLETMIRRGKMQDALALVRELQQLV